MIQITETVKELVDLMNRVGISKKAALVIGTNLKTEEQQKEMITFLTQNHKATNTQAIMKLDKILNKANK